VNFGQSKTRTNGCWLPRRVLGTNLSGNSHWFRNRPKQRNQIKLKLRRVCDAGGMAESPASAKAEDAIVATQMSRAMVLYRQNLENSGSRTDIRSNAAYGSTADCLLVPDVAASGHRDGGVEGISGSFELNPATYSFWWQHLHDVRTAVQVQSRAERTVGRRATQW
jgi:hypothetical protein